MSHRINRPIERFFQWNKKLNQTKESKRKDNEQKLLSDANSSKMSKGSKKIIRRHSSKQEKVECKTDRSTIREKLNAYLSQRESKHKNNPILPNYAYLKPIDNTPFRSPNRCLYLSPKGLLEENMMIRGEKWVEQRQQKLKKLRSKESEKELYECTFTPRFVTKTKAYL